MKKIIYNYLLVALIITFFSSCNDDEDIAGDDVKEALKIKFELGGEFELLGETPIGGRTENDLGTIYGVTIWKVIDGTTFYDAEGVFNDLSKIDYEFFSDETYNVFISAVNPGTSQGLSYYENSEDTILTKAFGESRILNQFSTFGPANNIHWANGFEVKINDDSTYSDDTRPIVDKFNGYVSMVNPSESDSVITIDMRRHSFGLAFKVTNIDNNDKLRVKFGTHNVAYRLDSVNNESYQIRVIYDNVNHETPIADDYEEGISVTLELDIYDENGNFAREKILTTRNVSVKRNVKRTYLIDIADFLGDGNTQDSEFELRYLDEELIDEGEFQFPQ